MKIIFHKTSHDRHGLSCVRDDRSVAEASNLESKSMLRHDFMHFIVEKNAGLQDTFYGPLSRGKSFDDLKMSEEGDQDEEGSTTEKIVALLQSAHREDFDPTLSYEQIKVAFENIGDPLPAYLTEKFIEKCADEFRFLLKRWNSLQTGKTLELEF